MLTINIMNFASADVKKRILALAGSEQPIKVIAEKLDISASTVSKYCLVLEAEKKIEIRKFGNMKMVKKR